MPDGNSPLNMGTPWDAISKPPGSDQGMQYDPRYGQELQDAIAKTRDFQASLVLKNKMQEDPTAGISAIKTNMKTGEVDLKMHKDAVEAFMRDHQELNQIRGAFHQEAERLQAQEQQIRNQPPWIQLATALSANLASQKDMPGWVRGLGQTAAQLNPQADQIRNQRLGVLGEEAKIAEKGANLSMGAAQMEESIAQRRQTQVTHAEEQRQKLIREAYDNLAQAVDKGPGQMDAKASARVLSQAGASPQEVETLMGQLSNLASNVKTKYDATRADKAQSELRAQANEERRNKLLVATLKTVGMKTSDKEDAKKALEETAQSLASGDLTSIRDVSSLRNNQRQQLYARIKELNPNFNTAEVNRKIATLQSFEVGKDSQAIQSFDTFLQHAGETADVLKNIELTNTPLLNKSLNWWRKNMVGTPELAALETSIEPVGKEFEKFLLAGGALYTDDRKILASLLNANQPLSVTMSTLKQMGKTTKDRYAAMNARYKKVMKQDIEDPFSEGAKAGANKIGLDLPTGRGSAAPQGAKKYPWEQ